VQDLLPRLHSLIIARCPGFTDLQRLAGNPLNRLWLQHGSITDLLPLQQLPSLQVLVLVGFAGIPLEPLIDLPALKSLRIMDAQGELDLTPLARRTKRLEVRLQARQRYTGVGQLGPLVRVKRV
jgi:hypothetical protein